MRIRVTLANPARREEQLSVDDALVDTGATFSTVPRSLAEQLGLDVLARRRVRTASGVSELDESFALLEYDGRQSVTHVLISDTYPGVLIGVVTLETWGLAVDPGTGQLRDSEILLLPLVGSGR